MRKWLLGYDQILGVSLYRTLRPFAALARPLPRVPRSPPRAAPPLPEGAIPPRLPPVREAGAGVANFGVAFEDVGGFSTNDVSVVLDNQHSQSHPTWSILQKGGFSINLAVKFL